MNKLNLQTTGDQTADSVPLNKQSPLTEEWDNKTGALHLQTSGDSFNGPETMTEAMPLNHTVVNDFRSNVSEGERQADFAERVPLSRTPFHGWDSAPTPMSTRAKKQQGSGS